MAMDTEEGVEVVWNEVQFSDKKIFKSFEVRPCLFSNIDVMGGILSMLCCTTNICEMLLYWHVIMLEWWYGDKNDA